MPTPSASPRTAASPVDLRSHLVDARLAGMVATPLSSTEGNCERLAAGDPGYTFGLSDWVTAELTEVRDAVARACGPQPRPDESGGRSWIDPERTVDAIERHRRRLAHHARSRSRVLVATGHPTGLLAHYLELARALAGAGCRLLAPLDNEWVGEGEARRRVRSFAGVIGACTGGDVVHTHMPDVMRALLDALERDGGLPDLVVGDHGMAGAAAERDIDTVGIADVNDPALFLAESRGRPICVLPIDDNLAPRLYDPVTSAMLEAVAP